MFNRNYKKGMADAAKAYESFGKKQEGALEYILEEVRQGKKELAETLQGFSGNLDGLYEHLRSQEKAQLYTTYTPFDIKELGGQEKLFLLGSLYRLAMERMPNEDQQDYLRAIQKYLDIKEPPMGVDPLMVENIEDIPAQKAILQAVLEFLQLQDGDSYAETELQQDFLDAFSINAKGFQTIIDRVSLLYKATGARGLAEKYGYVPEEEYNLEGDTEDTQDTADGQDISSTTIQRLEDMSIQKILHIPENETETFSHKRLHIQAFLNCDGHMEFDSCEIYYHESGSSDTITLGNGAGIVFTNCTFICEGYDETPFIKAERDNQIIFRDCTFKDCSRFLDAHQVKEMSMENCQINDCCEYFMDIAPFDTSRLSISNCKITENSLRECYQYLDHVGPLIYIGYETKEKCRITDTVFIQGQDFDKSFKRAEREHFSYLDVKDVSIENCTFTNVTYLFHRRDLSLMKNCDIKNSDFKDCCKIINGGYISSITMEHCRFEHCAGIALLKGNGIVSYCHFSNCYGRIIEHNSSEGKITIENCVFENVQQVPPKESYYAYEVPILLSVNNKCFSQIRKCIFDGIHLDLGISFLIGITSYLKWHDNQWYIQIEDCNFKNCTTQRKDKKIIETTVSEKVLFLGYTDYEVVGIRNCKGLDKVNETIPPNSMKNDHTLNTTNSDGIVDWDKVKEIIQQSGIGKEAYQRWIEPIVVREQDKGFIKLQISKDSVIYVKKHYDPLIKESIKKLAGHDVIVSYGFQ